MLQQGPRHIAHAVIDAAALALDQRQSLSRLEALLQHDTTAMGHDRRHRIGRAERPEQRHREPQSVAGAKTLPFADIEAVGEQRSVRQGDAFGSCRRSGRIEDVADVLSPYSLLRGGKGRCTDQCAPCQELRQ